MKNEKSDRRQFISQMTGAAALLSVSLPTDLFAKLEKYQLTDSISSVPPYLQNLSNKGVSIVVIEPTDTVTWLEINDGSKAQEIINKKDGFFEVGKGPKIFTINDLMPGKTYSYRVFSKEIAQFEPYDLRFKETVRSKEYSFTTLSEQQNSISCLIMNDIHDRPYTFKDLISLNKDPYEFVILNGDTFDYQTNEQQLIDHLIHPVTELFASEKPFLMVRGNHETRGAYARAFKDYFVYPKGEYYFSFQQGPVNFIVLDTGEDKPNDNIEYGGVVDFDSFREEQVEWLEGIMKSKTYKKSPFNVVLMHIPPFHSGNWHGPMHCRELFTPLFEKYKIDLVISGHTHRYGIHKPQKDHSYPIIIGGGPKNDARTIVHLKADHKKLSINMIRDDGVVVGELTLG